MPQTKFSAKPDFIKYMGGCIIAIIMEILRGGAEWPSVSVREIKAADIRNFQTEFFFMNEMAF